ncbi:MAG TPA: hypothetical protein VKH81_15075 [Candidatus Angelobacter sp.]|nr:hypothetical protein [Candidatus Angelobacter sp.]
MNMAAPDRKPFVYGDFYPEGRVGMPRPPVPVGYAPYALEILREFSASEFIAKVYQLNPSLQWSVLRPEDASRMLWYSLALKTPRMVGFNMQGSARWKIQNVRTESDEQGQYVAVALSSEK